MDDIKFEPLPKQIEEFEKAWTKNNPDKLPGYCHNIYHLISEDMNGNVTNEMYAVNCMTDYGFRSVYVNRSDWNPSYNFIYVGSGTSIPQTNSQSMETPISTTGSVNTNTNFTLSQQKFHPDTGILTCRFHLLSGYFDYTVFPEDKEVTEIGLGTSTTTLFYHARVYDAQGNPSSFIKKLNERLTIHVYITGCMKIADIVNRAWNKGLYLQFEPHMWFRRGYANWRGPLIVCYDAYHNQNFTQSSSWQPFEQDAKVIDGNVVTASRESALGSKYMEGRYEYVCDVNVNGGPTIYEQDLNDRYVRPNHARFLFKPKLETPEKITCFELYTNSFSSSDISNMFGMPTDNHERRSNGNIPVVDFDISGDDAGLWMYSCQDHDWTISENFVNAKDTAYDCEYIVYSDLIQNYYVEHLNDYTNFRVFLNTRPDIPITAFTLSGTATFYATDAWWDTGSWEIIPNVSSIPERLQTKRYYCTLKTDAFPHTSTFPGNMFGTGGWNFSFKTTRTQPVHSITTKEDSGWCNYGWTQTSWRDNSTTNSKVITNDEYGYVACADWLIYPDTIDPNADTYVDASTSDEGYWYRYRLCGTGDAFSDPCLIWNTTKGDKIVVGGHTTWQNGFRVYDVNNDPTVAPTYQDYLFETSWGTNNTPHWSFSNNGFVATSYISGTVNVNRTYILDWYGGNDDNTPVMSYIDGYHHGHIIDLTNYICAINADVVDHLSLDIIDMKTKEVYSTIDIPEGYTFQGMCGWKNWIYIRVEIAGAYSTYLYYIDRQTLTSLPINYPIMIIDNSSYYSHIQRAVEASGNCESCMVMIASNKDVANQYHLLFKSSDPENPIRILAEYTPSSDVSRYNRNAYVMNQAAQLRYVNDNKQLLLAIKNCRGSVIDIGRILDEGTQTLTLDFHYWYNEEADEGPVLGLYKNRVMHVMNHEYAWKIDGQSGNVWHRFYVNYYPIENFLPHKVIGYTRTINSYHNPKQIGGVTGIKVQLSNDVSIWDPQ